MVKLRDTSADAERVLIEVHRRMPIGQKWLHLGQMYDAARALHAAGMRLRNPDATPDDIHLRWLRNSLGPSAEVPLREPVAENPMTNLREIRLLVRIFAALQVRCAIGGSVASSIHGIERFTRDADISVEPFPGKEEAVAAALGPEYYVSLGAIKDAVRDHASFNIINTATGFKIDVFVRKDVPFEKSVLQRRLEVALPDEPAQPLPIYTAEDIVLFKLRWYRQGEETSEQQWQDVLGVIKVQAGRMDEAYLDRWAADLGVSDLLARARQESASSFES
jgi:hypothetical protein